MNIDKVIESLRDSDRYIETIFTEGSCYKFHLFLKTLHPKATPYFTEDREHVVTLIDGDFYDITGNVSDEQRYTLMRDEDVLIAEKWGFSKQKMLSFGECKFCEEPIVF